MSRRGFLELGLAATSLLAAAGCVASSGRRAGRYEGTIVSAPKGPENRGRGVEVLIPEGAVSGVLHPAEGSRGATVLVSGAGGGVAGPSGIYGELADRLRGTGVSALRLDYRQPNNLQECVYDVLSALDALGGRGIERAVLVGWSFGGAVVIDAGAESGRVVGVATIASQTYGAGDVDRLSPEKSLLLIHGTHDRVLPADLSRDLYGRAGEPKELILYRGDGHGIERHRSELLDKLYGWSKGLLLEEGAPP